MTKMAKKKVLYEAPMTEYEKIRAENMMRNNRRLQSIGLSALVSMVRKSNDHEGSAVTCDDEASGISQGSGSEYSPKDDEVSQLDGSDDTLLKQVKELKVTRRKNCAVKKKSSRRTSSPASTPSSASTRSSTMAPGKRVMPPPQGATKRMLQGLEPEDAPTRVTSQKKALEESLLLKDGGSQPHMDEESSMHMDEESSRHMEEGGGMGMESSHMVTNKSLTVAGVSEQQEQHTLVRDRTALVNHKRKGTGLQKITQGLGTKVTIQITKGMKRPEKPIQAAKFASECGYTARSLLPVVPHFKEYKKDSTLMKNYVGKVAGNFVLDTDSETVQKACSDLLQKITKNRRHLIKKKYFDPIPANKVSIKSPVEGLSDNE